MATRAHTVPKFYLSNFTAPIVNLKSSQFVWVGQLKTGAVFKKSPKNLSIVRGFYDGKGLSLGTTRSFEEHLSGIEREASKAIRSFTELEIKDDLIVPPEIWRFMAWQAARTPGWFDLVQRWIDETPSGLGDDMIEPPPKGLTEVSKSERPMIVENPKTGERHEVSRMEEIVTFQQQGWKWELQSQDFLELMHLQAWYFQIRHFPRFSWVRIDAPAGETFITSDRAVSWVVDGHADTPPAALRHNRAQIVAPLSRRVALVGRHGTNKLDVTPRDVNRFVAFASSGWIAGSNEETVRQALLDARVASTN